MTSLEVTNSEKEEGIVHIKSAATGRTVLLILISKYRVDGDTAEVVPTYYPHPHTQAVENKTNT